MAFFTSFRIFNRVSRRVLGGVLGGILFVSMENFLVMAMERDLEEEGLENSVYTARYYGREQEVEGRQRLVIVPDQRFWQALRSNMIPSDRDSFFNSLRAPEVLISIRSNMQDAIDNAIYSAGLGFNVSFQRVIEDGSLRQEDVRRLMTVDLQELDLSKQILDNETVIRLSEFIGRNAKLESLSLEEAPIDVDGVVIVLRSLEGTRISRLNLNGLRLGL